MTTGIFPKQKDKPSVYNQNYLFCDICTFNGYPNEKVVFVIHGFRHEDEDGFAIKFTQYDYPIQNEKVHVHKYDGELIKSLVNQSLCRSWE
jgi:hypothetical protein